MSDQKKPAGAYDAQVMQNWVNEDRTSEPEYKSRTINTLNKQCASKRKGVCLRLPKPNGCGDCLFSMEHSWTDAEAARYLADGTLPCDLKTIGQDSRCAILYIFDARGCGNKLPEVQFEEVVPDFKAKPALCAFDVGVEDHVALIPSGHLEMVPTGLKKVRFVLNQ